nr:hypothetical protein [Tanacetum cinerariifolium]
MTESPLVDSDFAVLVFSLGDDLIACINKVMAFLIAVASSRFPSTKNQLKTSLNTRNQDTIQDGRVTVQQVQGRQEQSYFGTGYKSNATSSGGNNEAKNIENEIDLEKKIKELDNIIFKVDQSANTVHMLTKPQGFYDNIHKQALGYENLFYLKKAQRIKPTLYDGIVISAKHVAMPVIDNEETLIFKEESRSKMAKKEAPKELPKVSLVNESLKKLKLYLSNFDKVVKIRTTPNAQTEEYLKKTQKQANILQGIVKQAKAKQPLDNSLDFACKHAQRIQELLVYVRDTCPNTINLSAKKVDVTPKNNVKKFRKLGLKSSTSNCRSKPTRNKKNDMISQTPSRNMMHKVEAQPRNVNKKNHVVESIRNVDVK